MKKHLRVALCQIRLTDDADRNAGDVAATISGLRGKADLAVFPETALAPSPPKAGALPAARETEARLGAVRNACRRAGVGAAVGAIVRSPGGHRNTAFLVSKDGRIIGRTDKAHLPGAEGDMFEPAAARPRVRSFHGVRIGLQICFDARFGDGFRHLGDRGAELICVLFNARGPQGWKREMLRSQLSARAAENGLALVSVNDATAPQLVASHAFDSRGVRLLSTRPDRREIRVVRIDPSATRAYLRRKRRRDLYGPDPSSRR